MGIALIIGGVLLAIGLIWHLIIWIKTIMKCFKAEDTLWGVLTIFLSPLLGIIWLFMNGHKKPAINWIIATVLGIVGYVVVAGAIVSKAIQEGGQTMPLQ